MRNLSDYINSRELVETTDPDFQRPLYRQEGFDGIVSFGEIDAKLSAFLLDERAKTGLTQSDFATLAGLARVVYSRYELNISRLTVSRMIHLSELLGFLPMQMIHAAALIFTAKILKRPMIGLNCSDLFMTSPTTPYAV